VGGILSFAIWSPERLYAYNFLVPLDRRIIMHFRTQLACYAWQSVIVPDEEDVSRGLESTIGVM